MIHIGIFSESIDITFMAYNVALVARKSRDSYSNIAKRSLGQPIYGKTDNAQR